MSSPKVQLIRDLGCGLGGFSTHPPVDEVRPPQSDSAAEPQNSERQEAPAQE